MNFYYKCASILDSLNAKQGSIKSLVATLPEADRKRGAALVIETLKYRPVLLDVINASKLLEQEKNRLSQQNLVLLLVHDVLFGRGIQAGDGPIKQAVLRHKTRMKAELVMIKVKRGIVRDEDLAPQSDSSTSPRWVRINTNVSTKETVTGILRHRGFMHQHAIEDLKDKSYHEDKHATDLLALPPDIRLLEDELFLTGKVILQDKASCFPGLVLSPPTGVDIHVIDATAAPGNKTSHLSALMKNEGKIFAFERDRKRFQTLKMMLARAATRNVEPINADFLSIDPNDYAHVSHILVDPSCSGSGIVNRLDALTQSEDRSDGNPERLEKLAAFQLKMIQHSMKFPSVQKIVYSTCSIHVLENEHVVFAALKSKEATEGGFALAPRAEVIPIWPRRGLDGAASNDDEHGMLDSFIRCRPEDGTNGFFVACLVREHSKRANPMKRKAEEDLDDLIEVGHEREGIGEYEEWHGISGNDPGLASQSVTNGRKKKRKKKARLME